MTRDEFAIYDLTRNIAGTFFFVSMLNIILGKAGMRTVWREKPWCTNWISKKSALVMFVIFMMMCFAKHEKNEFRTISKRYRDHTDDSTIEIPSDVNTTESNSETIEILQEPTGRNLREHGGWEGKHHGGHKGGKCHIFSKMCAAYFLFSIFHMYNLRTFFRALKTVETKRIEMGEKVETNWWGHCGGKWKNKDWKNKKCGGWRNKCAQ